MNQHMAEVNGLLEQLNQAAAARVSKNVKLQDRLDGVAQHIADLKKKLDAAILGDQEEEESRLMVELRQAQVLMTDIEGINERTKAAKIEHVVSPKALIAAFVKVYQATREDMDASIQRAMEAKQEYEAALADMEEISKQYGQEAGRVAHAIQFHFNQSMTGQLPKLKPPSDPYLSREHYNERV
ncbi:hypothetical protein [Paenibacillus alkalitolerans]|uniref:hypothetical protein n=1 Tax=Paenibacillus alkalitolerans TaxID=2799335 RepID=UPI0018F28950|nr:hypothetical protein [Paenibacillus alkalitolerans]